MTGFCFPFISSTIDAKLPSCDFSFFICWVENANAFSGLLEPRGGNQDDFDDTLKGYYDSIRQGGKTDIGRKRKGKNLGLKNLKATERPEKSKNGAAFLAVCRGKVLK